MATVVLIDDHTLLRNALAGLIQNMGHNVLFEADNGKVFIEKLLPNNLPDIVLMDVNMPEMDGYETAKWLKENYPDIKILALSMYDDDMPIIRMLKYGAKGYILKDSSPIELSNAIDALLSKGFYYSDHVSGKLINSINLVTHYEINIQPHMQFSDVEIKFIKLCCSELTYKEIAGKLNLSYRTIEKQREALFEKVNSKSRVGLIIYALKNRIISID